MLTQMQVNPDIVELLWWQVWNGTLASMKLGVFLLGTSKVHQWTLPQAYLAIMTAVGALPQYRIIVYNLVKVLNTMGCAVAILHWCCSGEFMRNLGVGVNQTANIYICGSVCFQGLLTWRHLIGWDQTSNHLRVIWRVSRQGGILLERF